MSWAFESAVREVEAELSEYDIDVRTDSNYIVTREKAIKVDMLATSDKCRRILRTVINDAKKKKAEKLQAQQSTLF